MLEVLEMLLHIFSFLLFVFEIFLATTQFFVIIGARSLPYKDMLRLRHFFVFAGLTVTTSSMIVPSDIWVMETLLAAHHLYMYINWDVSPFCKKVIWWISLNCTENRLKEFTLCLGSLCVVFVHGYHAFLLGCAFNFREVMVGIVIGHCAVMSVIYNSRLAWAARANIPKWVAKRVAENPVKEKSS